MLDQTLNSRPQIRDIVIKPLSIDKKYVEVILSLA
jgi:hypothetical protein